MALGLSIGAAANPLAARRAAADDALYLTWDDCEAGGSHDQTFGCGANDVTLELFLAFSAAIPTGPDVLSLEAVVDVQHSLPTLPDWWRMAGSGECRSGQMLASVDFSAANVCVDPWAGTGSAEVQGYSYGEPHPVANQLRIKVVAGVPSNQARTLAAGVIYYGMKVLIKTDHSTGTGVCAGCSSPACLVLNSILVRSVRGPAFDRAIVTPGAGNANRATWRGGAGADCAAVPARRMTWGSIKSLYR